MSPSSRPSSEQVRSSIGLSVGNSLNRLRRASPIVRFGVVGILTLATICADLATGPDVSMVLLQSFVVVAATWAVRPVLVALAVTAMALANALDGFRTSDVAVSVAAANVLLRLATLVVVGLLCLALRQYVEAVEHAARTDPLTGLPNRRALIDALAAEIGRRDRHGVPFSLAFLDLDGLKRVNDELGHAAGDRVLCDFAELLVLGVRNYDVVARLGGDEFAVLLPGTTAADGRAVLERVLASPDAPEASIGVIDCSTGTSSDPDWFLARADDAMYLEKRHRRDRSF